MKAKKKTPKGAANQFRKGLGRVAKVTIFHMLRRRFEHWSANELDPKTRDVLNELHLELFEIEKLRHTVMQQMTALGDYTPPATNHTGELKLTFGRQVWLKPKFKSVYTEAFTAEQLSELRVMSVVNGRVIVLLGPFQPNEVDSMPRTIVPKLHLTATPD